jgi:aspartate kinase
MSIIVQKFGGTSVSTPESRLYVLGQVLKAREEGNQVVVVVSAMGRKGDPYATDTLIQLLEEISPKIIPKKNDLIMSCGETIACALMSHYLESNGIPSEPLTGCQAGILTTDHFNNSEVVSIDTQKIMSVLEEGKVPVIAGFQGTTSNGDITTLGRGGGDTTAVAIGGYLNAKRVDIFTDVLGIAKVDPRVLPTAPYMLYLSYNDMLNLAENGAKVIHPKAVAMAQKFGIPLRVRSTFSDNEGTLIAREPIVTGDKVIGLALEKGDLETKLFVLFDHQRLDEIKKDLERFAETLHSEIGEIVWTGNSFVMKLPNANTHHAVKTLYETLIG